MHRPGIASVQGDTIVLDGTTMDELETVHVTTLKIVIDKLNRDVADALERERVRREREERARASHRDEVDNIAGRLNFD
jgi:outer membrane murein-binding lipoprotein Lpp